MPETIEPSRYYEAGKQKELGKSAERKWGFDKWGSCLLTNEDGSVEQSNFYRDPKISHRLFTQPLIEAIPLSEQRETLKIIDFGGGEGLMLSQIITQIHEAGFEHLTPVLFDADMEKLELGKKRGLEPVQGDVFHMPFVDNSFDAGVSRMLLQYFPPPKEGSDRPTQYDILKEMYRVMKSGSTLVIVWPGAYKYNSDQEKRRAGALDLFWSQITYDRVDRPDIPFAAAEAEDPGLGRRLTNAFEDLNSEPGHARRRSRAFTPGAMMADFAKMAGFEVREGEEEDWLEFRYTYQAILDRFDPNGELPDQNKKWIRFMFDHLTGAMKRNLQMDDESNDDFVKKNDEYAIRLPISRLVLRKE